MSDRNFTHGGSVECPKCPGVGVRKRKPKLRCQERNYSGCSVDIGFCWECGKGFEVSFTVKEVTHVEALDGESRAEREANEKEQKEREKQEMEKREREELARLKGKYDA